MQVLGTVDAGADLHLVVEEEGELLLVHQREVGHHGELEELPHLAVLRLGVLDEVLDHGEVDQRLAALKLDGDVG
jgi:hypothetical protein